MGKNRDILYLCDGLECESCNGHCQHTADIEHAINFEKKELAYVERKGLSKLMYMFDESTKKSLKEILDHYGPEPQKNKTLEELFELGQAIFDETHNHNEISVAHIIEEMADVYIMMEQMKMLYGIDDRGIHSMIEYKIKRTLGRMKHGRQHENSI